MHPGELAGVPFLLNANLVPSPAHFASIQTRMPALNLSRFSGPYQPPNFQIPSQIHEFHPQASCLSNNSTSDETEEQQLSVIDERKHRRMISNRESARRSRMRKQKHLDELLSQVVHLRSENRQLIDKLNSLSEYHEKILRENACFKEEASDLRQKLQELQLGNCNVLRDLEEVSCNTAHLRAESTNQLPVTTSMDLLH